MTTKLILAGQIPGFAPIGYREVTIPGDGTLRFEDTNGHQRTVQLTGDVGILLREVWSDCNGSRITVFGTD